VVEVVYSTYAPDDEYRDCEPWGEAVRKEGHRRAPNEAKSDYG